MGFTPFVSLRNDYKEQTPILSFTISNDKPFSLSRVCYGHSFLFRWNSQNPFLNFLNGLLYSVFHSFRYMFKTFSNKKPEAFGLRAKTLHYFTFVLAFWPSLGIIAFKRAPQGQGHAINGFTIHFRVWCCCMYGSHWMLLLFVKLFLFLSCNILNDFS